MPSPSQELLDLYDRALELTERQARAIELLDWDTLNHLLAEREPLVQRAGDLLERGIVGQREAIASRLKRLTELDEANRKELEARRAEIVRELQEVEHSKSALSGYLDAFRLPTEPRFLDRDQ